MSELAEEDTPESIPPTGRKRIMITLRRKTVTDKAIAALGSRPNLGRQLRLGARHLADPSTAARGGRVSGAPPRWLGPPGPRIR